MFGFLRKIMQKRMDREAKGEAKNIGFFVLFSRRVGKGKRFLCMIGCNQLLLSRKNIEKWRKILQKHLNFCFLYGII
jgi:hypothetical protein